MLGSFFNPRSVAVIGASTKPRSLGHVLLKNIVEGGYEGDVYPINPRAGTILGLRTYPFISDVEAVVDLAIVMVPSTIIIEVARQCGEKG
jgi:acyl-CoA synthetase (NDP forming)